MSMTDATRATAPPPWMGLSERTCEDGVVSDKSTAPAGEPTGGAGRYNGSPTGVIGAMILTVVLVLGVVLVRSLFRADVNQGPPQAIDYLDTVLVYQTNGLEVVYPSALPDGWIVTEISAEAGERPTYRINLYTDDDTFVGIRQENASVDNLIETYVDASPSEEDPLTGVGGVAATWEGWSDSGGDRAFSAEVGNDTVVVYGDVSADDLSSLVALLSIDPLPGVSARPSATPTPSPSPASTP